MKARNLEEEFRRFRGQPIEIITEGIKFCGIDIDSDDDSVDIIDDCNRIVHIPFRHIDAVIEPMMKLHRFCGKDDCDCDEEEEEECHRCHCDEDDDRRERRRERGEERREGRRERKHDRDEDWDD